MERVEGGHDQKIRLNSADSVDIDDEGKGTGACAGSFFVLRLVVRVSEFCAFWVFTNAERCAIFLLRQIYYDSRCND